MTELIKLLGEKNKQRLQEEVTNILINRFREDIDDSGEYLIDFDELFADLAKDIQREMTEWVYSTYFEEVKNKMKELLHEKMLSDEQ